MARPIHLTVKFSPRNVRRTATVKPYSVGEVFSLDLNDPGRGAIGLVDDEGLAGRALMVAFLS